VQYANCSGFETLAVTRSQDKEQFARELGADEVVGDGDGLRKAGGADVILATSNSMKATSDALKGLRPDGRLVVMGFSAREKLEIPSDILFTRAHIVGSQQNGPEYLYEALDYVAKGKVKVIAETYGLDQIHRAYERVAEGKVRFRAVIVN
jgi:D-arabinose 1-dehydrogenase-like Zn-dependent alcohol dehydrogenase